MKDSSKEVLRYPLQILGWCGQNPEQGKTKHFVITGLYVVLGTIAQILTVLQFVYANGNVIAIAQNYEAFVSFAQLISKSLIVAIKMRNFLKMIDDAKKFWSIKKCTQEMQAKLEGIFIQILHLERLYIRIVTLTMVLAVISPSFTKKLPTGQWMMKDHDKLFIYALILQEILIPILVIFVAAYDILFLSFCILLRTQFTLLNYFLKDLRVSSISNKEDEKMYLNKLISCIQYHDFLLKFSRNMQDTYSPVMLIEYCTIMLLSCGEMYVMFERDSRPKMPSPMTKFQQRTHYRTPPGFSIPQIQLKESSKDVFQFLRCSLGLTVALLQLAFYCVPLNYVTDEAVLVSQGIYNSDWYSKYVPILKTTMSLVIQRSQQEIVFRAGGMFDMNCRTLLSVFRTAYSVCTIMRALKNV